MEETDASEKIEATTANMKEGLYYTKMCIYNCCPNERNFPCVLCLYCCKMTHDPNKRKCPTESDGPETITMIRNCLGEESDDDDDESDLEESNVDDCNYISDCLLRISHNL